MADTGFLRKQSASHRLLRCLPFAGFFGLVAGVLGLSAYWQLFTTFRFWDDEGYVLISLRNFAGGGKLYADVCSQYGPAYNLFYTFLHRHLGVPLDTESARYLTLVAWVLTSLLGADLVRRFTDSWLWAGTAAMAVFVHLHLLTHEPLHPVGLIAVLLVAGAVGATRAIIRNRPRVACRWAATAGVLLALVKLNVGLFFLSGTGLFVLWATRGPLTTAWSRGLLAALAVLAGIGLLSSLWHEHWVMIFLTVYTVAAGGTLWILAREITPDWSGHDGLRPCVMTAAVVLVVVFGWALAAGVTPGQLWDGVIRDPLRHATAFVYAFRWSRLTLVVLGGNIAAFALYLAWGGQGAWTERLVAAGRLMVGAGYLFSFYHAFAVSPEGYLLSFGAGALWVCAVPLAWNARCRPELHRARLLLAALALFQVLHAFPVAGTQVNLCSVLLVLLLVVTLAEVVAWARAPGQLAGLRACAALIGLGAVTLALCGFVRLTWNARQNYLHHPAEIFSGAGLRLSAWQASTLGTLTANARWHGDMLFSLPGLFSFNLWAGLPTPNQLNITHWWSLLDESQLKRIAERLESAARPVVIIQRHLITGGLAARNYRPTLLSRYLDAHFTLLFSLDSYEFWVRHGMVARPLGIARWQTTDAGVAFAFFQPAGTTGDVAGVSLLGCQPDAPPALTLLKGEFTLTRSPVASAAGLEEWRVTWLRPVPVTRNGYDATRFLAANGHVLMEARFERPSPQANPE
jgi:hypothetical protein